MAGSTRHGAGGRKKWLLLGALASVLVLATACDLTGDPPANSSQFDPDRTTPPLAPAVSPLSGCGAERVSYGTNSLGVETGTGRRSALIYVPGSYEPHRPTPLLLSFHRAGTTASQHRAYANFIPYSEASGFVLVLPYADLDVGSWRTSVGARADVEFIERLLVGMGRQLCVDTERIYAAGFSDGGVFAHLLACSGTRLAGLAVVALQRTDLCPAARPLAAIGFHGTADPIQPFETVHPDEWAEGWAQTNGCDVVPFSLSEAVGVRTSRWTNCDEGSPVAFFTLEGGGHTWPGADTIDSLGATIDTLDASAEIVRFFGLDQ